MAPNPSRVEPTVEIPVHKQDVPPEVLIGEARAGRRDHALAFDVVAPVGNGDDNSGELIQRLIRTKNTGIDRFTVASAGARDFTIMTA